MASTWTDFSSRALKPVLSLSDKDTYLWLEYSVVLISTPQLRYTRLKCIATFLSRKKSLERINTRYQTFLARKRKQIGCVDHLKLKNNVYVCAVTQKGTSQN